HLLSEAKKIGFPVMIKASAGGGGKGMRKVENEKEFLLHLESAKREAKNFFMNDHVFIEKFISSPRHIEVQVFGDKHGNYIHLFERDCSVQRRNQKVIEEAPAISLSHNVKEKIYEAALKAVKGIQYENAGTVEFVVDKEENFYFLEMNTRLQVEHPVTEQITGLDLVELQIRVAENEKLPSQETIKQKGHSIELRIYAEENDIPSSGMIYKSNFYPFSSVRIDSGIQDGVNISTYYDSMLAKVIVYSQNRESCIHDLITCLNNSYIHGIPNNLYYLKRILEHPEFQHGRVTTKFIESFINSDYLGEPVSQEEVVVRTHILFGRKIVSNFRSIFSNFRIWNESSDLKKEKLQFDQTFTKGLYHFLGKDFLVEVISLNNPFQFKVTNLKAKNFQYVQVDTKKMEGWNFTQVGYKMYLSYKAKSYLVENIALSQRAAAEGEGAFRSPMPGKIISILAKEGSVVKEGSPILIVEAMKMENAILAPENLIVEKIFVKVGDLVTPETQLIQVKPYLDE
ncbi:MAG: ATP-grasp domain-containing protein, partial [Leptospiraceae bacterium]|nr:ATP-grasp domain-containing protein [Leptospiraceae bacterium]